MTVPNAGLGRGDRAPDFWLPNPDGTLGRFYDRFMGNLVVLFFFPSQQDEMASRELLGFVEQARAFETAGAKMVAVTRDSDKANAATAAAHGIEFTVFSDPEGAITRGYGVAASAGGAALATFVLDRNQRVLEVFRGTEGSHAPWALSYLKTRLPAPEPAEVITMQAPVQLIPNVFEADVCARLIRDWENNHAEGEVRRRAGAAVEAGSRVVDHAIKKRLDHRPGPVVNRDLIEIVLRRIAPEAYKAFQFKTAMIENFCIGGYDAERGDYFRPHRDNTTVQTANRRFAVTVNLNDDYEGGNPRFPEFSAQLYRPPAGGAALFSCSLLHEATPVTRGRRFVALTFLAGPGDQQRGGAAAPVPGPRPTGRT